MSELPTGTVTSLFTDIEGGTRRWEEQPEAMRVALARHDALLRAAIVEHHGYVVKTMGDAFHAGFAHAPDALAATLDAQRRLQREPWGEIGPLRVRMALHTGAAEAICASATGAEIEVLDVVASLTGKSLIRRDAGDPGEPRFAMLETIREYGVECLEDGGEIPDSRRRHAAYYLELAEQASPMLRGPEQQAWLARLEAEHDNLRSVLSLSQAAAGDPTIGLCMAWALQWYLNMRASLDEARRLVEAVLPRTSGAPSALRAKVLFIAAMLAKIQLDLERAQTLLAESLDLARAYGDVKGIASALGGLSDLALDRGDFDRARALAGEVVVLIQELGDPRLIALAHAGLGRITQVEGDYARAESAYQESLAVRRALGDKHGVAWSLHYLALIATERDDHGRALTLDIESPRLRHEIDDRRGIAGCLEGLADLAVRDDEAERGVCLMAAAGALREVLKAPRAAYEESHSSQVLAAARAAVPSDTFEVAWAEGRSMTLEQAVTYALEEPGRHEPSTRRTQGRVARESLRGSRLIGLARQWQGTRVQVGWPTDPILSWSADLRTDLNRDRTDPYEGCWRWTFERRYQKRRDL